ncbi:hypothetical protein GCM10019059_26680 [Camelimonas fluminis]|nr:hypothetical protein GCM10019059_26680 [Camelimonas fluminis]
MGEIAFCEGTRGDRSNASHLAALRTQAQDPALPGPQPTARHGMERGYIMEFSMTIAHDASRLSLRAPRVGFAVAGALLAAVAVAGCQTTKSTTDMLSASGFSIKVASTPQQQAALASLPAGTFTMRHVKGKPVFIFADPKGCNCIYVGSEASYQQFKALSVQRSIANQELMAAQLNQQAAWDYQTWGGWGGPGWWWW